MSGRNAGSWGRGILLLLLLGISVAAGCSSANNDSGLNFITPQGAHPSGWLSAAGPSLHSSQATGGFIRRGDVDLCASCHGDDLSGGIARTDCLASCHHDPRFPQFVDWADPAVHGASAKRAPGGSSFFSCQICHAADFTGGAAAIACSDCHGVPAPHPAQWLPGDAFVHTDTDEANAAVCARCHLNGANSPLPPPSPPAAAGTPPGCFNNTLCHGQLGANHPVPFLAARHTSVTPAGFSTDCQACHAVTGTSPDTAAPLCTVCHAAGSPLALSSCTSCHASPPSGGTGAAYPNIGGAHAAHIALNGAGTPVSCDTCHNGLGTGTINHYNRANARPGKDALRVPPGDAAFAATYNAKTGAPSFDNSALSCANVSCHGGQANLNWRTGALNVNAQCTSCHASGTAQFNSYNSGRHTSVGEHVANGCTSCHDTARLAPGHFTNLATPAFEQAPPATLKTGLQYNGTTCNPSAGGITGCHGQQTW